MSTPQLVQLYESCQDIFEDIIEMLRGDIGFRNLFQSCRTFHSGQAFLRKISSLKLRLWNEEACGTVATQLATVPRGAHITKLVVCNSSGVLLPQLMDTNPSPFTTFQRGVLSHLNHWRPGMLELGGITALELSGIAYAARPNGCFCGTLHVAFPNLQHLNVANINRSEELLSEVVAAGVPLKSLVVTCDRSYPGSDPDLFGAIGRLPSLEALTIHAGCAHHQELPLLAGLTNLTSFTWDTQDRGDFKIELGDFGGVFPSWNRLSRLSLFVCAPRIPTVPTSLKHLHINLLHSLILLHLPPLPKGLVFSTDFFLLDCLDHETAHNVLTNLEQLQASVHTSCSHLRLLCCRQEEKRSLQDVLPLLAAHSRFFVQANTHEVSAMHVKVMPGDLPQLAQYFDGISKLGLVDYDLTSLRVLTEAVQCLPSLSVLQLRFMADDKVVRTSQVNAACSAGQVRQQSAPLTIEYEVYPHPEDSLDVPEWMDAIKTNWESSTAGQQDRVMLKGVQCRFAGSASLDDELF